MNEVRINLLGAVMPWWDSNIRFGELIKFGGYTWQQSAAWVSRYDRYLKELRHATMLEF